MIPEPDDLLAQLAHGVRGREARRAQEAAAQATRERSLRAANGRPALLLTPTRLRGRWSRLRALWRRRRRGR